jgi:hypothetical protein
MNETQTHEWTPDEIREKLETDIRWLERAVVAIWDRQTTDEQLAETTKHHNARGFSAPDARYLSYVTMWIKAGNRLSKGHVERVRNRMLKYAGQLARIANGEI